MQEYKVKFEESNQRIDNFLTKKYVNINKPLIYKSIRKNKIKVNNKRTKLNYILKNDDIIQLYLNDEILQITNKDKSIPLSDLNLNIVYEDENIMIIFKDREIKMHDGNKSLLNCCLKYLYEKNKNIRSKENYYVPSFSNRLDTNTSGLVIMCKNAISSKIINQIIKDNCIIKIYSAVIFGQSNFNNEIHRAFLKKDDHINKVIVKKDYYKESKEIITKFKTIKNTDKYSLLKIQILTGKTHQIRAHLKFLGYNIVGDNKYGDFEKNKKCGKFKQCLSANHIKFDLKKDYGHLNYLHQKEFKIEDEYIKNLII